MTKLLEGVKVVELANFIAAATAGRFLADCGAEVIKVESAKGDPLRFTAPGENRPLDMHENTTWELENANKKCISINLRTEKGKEVFFKMLEDADVLITNWRVQALERAGLDYDTIKERFPKLVYALCTGYGEKGPDRNLPGFDFTAFFARGGYLETLRQKNSKPMNVVPGVGDHNVGMNLAAGILAALYHAKVTGVGEKVETSLFESAIFNMGMMVQAANYDLGAKDYPIDCRERVQPFLSAWNTKDDRYIQTCMPDYNTYYNKFMVALDREDLVDNPTYFPLQNLINNKLSQQMYDMLMDIFKTKTAAEWSQILRVHDIPFGLAQNWEEILNDEQAWANDCLHKMKYDNGNERTLVCLPVKFENMGKPEYNKGPMIGEHGAEIVESLGYNKDEVATMLENKELYIWKDEK